MADPKRPVTNSDVAADAPQTDQPATKPRPTVAPVVKPRPVDKLLTTPRPDTRVDVRR